jgi:ubiquinone/menaquinone biosynthesis C-methylase UbiE
MPLYDRIGITYDITRKADPDVTRHLGSHLDFKPGACYLDVACGSGNYTVALHKMGARMCGLELTSTMLEKARQKSDWVDWLQGNAEALPFRDRSFEGATCTFAIHHMNDAWRAFEEIFRVIDHGRFVIFTSDRAQLAGYWLNEYFPNMMGAVIEQAQATEEIVHHLKRAGFSKVELKPWEIPRDLQDWFMYAGKYRPEIYFDPAVRAGISSFAGGLATPEETAVGLARLKADLDSGRFVEVAARHQDDLGDYLFVVATKA